jgi:D-sedoheptulose 7-phosphate isomerase
LKVSSSKDGRERESVSWIENAENLKSILQSLAASDDEGKGMDPELALFQWEQATLMVREAERTIYLIGNGASASMASHVAADLAKNAHVHTEVFSDLSLITALANDLGYQDVFAEPLRRRMKEGDMLVATSSSGQSPNILRACREAKNREGTVITLSAMKPDNPLRSEGMINFYLPAPTYGLAETGHAALLHYWMDQVVMGGQSLRERKSTEIGKRQRKTASSWIG